MPTIVGNKPVKISDDMKAYLEAKNKKHEAAIKSYGGSLQTARDMHEAVAFITEGLENAKISEEAARFMLGGL